MNNFIFKSPKGLVKNSSIDSGILDRHLKQIQTELRFQRTDLLDIKRMLNRLLIDKHLQMQVDNYFEDHPEDNSQEDSQVDETTSYLKKE